MARQGRSAEARTEMSQSKRGREGAVGGFRAASLLRVVWAALLTVALSTGARDALGWTYPEHRDIVMKALGDLDPERRKVFDAIWAEARSKHAARFCARADETTQPGAWERVSARPSARQRLSTTRASLRVMPGQTRAWNWSTAWRVLK